eukprot:Em0007g943a
MAKPLLLPESYGGEGDWAEWAEHFESIAIVNKWATAEEKLKWLRVHASYRKGPNRIASRSEGKLRKRQLYVAELSTRTKCRDEDRATFGDALS